MAGKKKIRRNVPKAVVNILASFNNTIVTFAAPNGETLCWDSAGHDRIQGLAQVDAVRCPEGGGARRREGPEDGGA